MMPLVVRQICDVNLHLLAAARFAAVVDLPTPPFRVKATAIDVFRQCPLRLVYSLFGAWDHATPGTWRVEMPLCGIPRNI